MSSATAAKKLIVGCSLAASSTAKHPTIKCQEQNDSSTTANTIKQNQTAKTYYTIPRQTSNNTQQHQYSDFLIIGGGIAGSSLAFHLCERLAKHHRNKEFDLKNVSNSNNDSSGNEQKYTVNLLESNIPGAGCTGLSAGTVFPMWEDVNAVKGRLVKEIEESDFNTSTDSGDENDDTRKQLLVHRELAHKEVCINPSTHDLALKQEVEAAINRFSTKDYISAIKSQHTALQSKTMNIPEISFAEISQNSRNRRRSPSPRIEKRIKINKTINAEQNLPRGATALVNDYLCGSTAELLDYLTERNYDCGWERTGGFEFPAKDNKESECFCRKRYESLISTNGKIPGFGKIELLESTEGPVN